MHVLLVNDDGPPAPDSPYIFGFYKHLIKNLNFSSVQVVIPTTQKSWIGKAYHIKELTKGVFYYPREPDGLGESSEVSRPLKEGEVAEWILLDGTPATCTNIAIHNLFPSKQFDLVISGPNFGRNSSVAFTMSSGTVGAAMSSAITGIRSIAISYGTVTRPTPISYFEPAHTLGGKIIQHLLNNWGLDKAGRRRGEVDLYNINIPMIECLLSDDGLTVYWTSLWKNSYSRLFKSIPASSSSSSSSLPEGEDGGTDEAGLIETEKHTQESTSSDGRLLFGWAPDIQHLIFPDDSVLTVGSDAWALRHGAASITPLQACFGEPMNDGDDTTGLDALTGTPVQMKLW